MRVLAIPHILWEDGRDSPVRPYVAEGIRAALDEAVRRFGPIHPTHVGRVNRLLEAREGDIGTEMTGRIAVVSMLRGGRAVHLYRVDVVP